MDLTQEAIDKIILIQANVRGFLVRQQITRQLIEIYEYEKEHLEYLQGQQFNQDYYSSEYGLNYDQQDQQIQKMYEPQNHKYGNVKQTVQHENFKKNNYDDDNINNTDNECIQFENSSSYSSGTEIEMKVQEKSIQQQTYLKDIKQAQEYQLYGKDVKQQQQKLNKNVIDASNKQNKDICFVTRKNEVEYLKFPHLNPIFSNSQMKQLVNNSGSFEDQQVRENNQNKEKLKNIAKKVYQNDEEEQNQIPPDNYKIHFYSQSANIAKNYDENEDESIQEIYQHQIEKGKDKNVGKQKINDYNQQQQYYKENQPCQDYLNQKSVNISVEMTESNLLAEKRLYLLPISNHNNQYNIQKNSDLQSNNNIQKSNTNQQKNQQPNANNNKLNQNRFYQDDEQYYINQQLNLYQQDLKNNHNQYLNPKQNGEKYNKDKNQQNMIQIIDQFNYSPRSQSSNSINQREEHFHKISNIEYRSSPGDNFLFEDSQNYAAYHKDNLREDFYHHEHHPQLASFMEPQENNELIINKSVFIKNMGVIKQMQEEQKRIALKTHSSAHEKNMKKIRKMCHMHPILNSKNHKQFLQISSYSLESYNSSKYEIQSQSQSQLETSQQQKHNNGQIFDINGSEQQSMMSSRVPESSLLKTQKNSLNKQKQNNIGSMNKKITQPIMFDFDIYILAATKIQKVFKGYLSRKHILEYKQVKKATLIIESNYLRFKQFLVKRMKDCTNQIECSSYNIIKFVQDFEKGEKFLKSQFRKKNFDQKIKINRDKLCKVFIQFINNNHSKEKSDDSKNMSLEQQNFKLQKEVLLLKQSILQQQKHYKQDIESMQQKYEELRNLHKETIKKYISGIQNLSSKRRGSNQQESPSHSSKYQEQTISSQQLSPQYNRNKHEENKNKNEGNKNNNKLINFYKESEKAQLNKIKAHNYVNLQDGTSQQTNLKLTQTNGKTKTQPSNNHNHHDEIKRSSSKSPDKYSALKRFELLKDEAERDLKEFEKRIKKIKYEHTSSKSPQCTNRKSEQKQQIQNLNGKKVNRNSSLENDRKKNNNLTKYHDYEYYCSDNNSIQQFMSQEFINYNKTNKNSSSKK